ncbi:nitrate- and nitrite sensing domain-containing protein [Streptomyces sp. JB150]|uniref:nitrate- and nitrite sensing domain-containing protein n=1 Tax=Streptomyces sp. JB150 TaxID=2714844 RepID=UPI0019D1F017|nr:nitrate- and nitrite sensing domain-containing protein [Streptomyces sp. JB150]
MQKKRPRRTGKQTAPQGAAEHTPVGKGRPTHVRNRLIVAVAVVAAAIAGAGAPSVLAAAGQASDTQELVALSEQTRDALALAHALADERDEVIAYVAAGRPKSKAPSEQRSARVDRQVEELRGDTDTPARLLKDLDGIAAVRRAALTGKSTALEAHQAYSDAIAELHRLAEDLAQQLPPRAGAGAYALAELDTAVQQAAATRGLLLAALSVPRSTQTVIDPVTGLPATAGTSSEADTKARTALTAAAQQARLRSDAALADFRETAPKPARASYDSTVTGPEVNSAEKYLASLTDQPSLSDRELATDAAKLNAALSARVDAMRGVEAALYDRRVKDLEALRDDDVTALEIRIGILGALLLLAVGVATAMARSLTRPLAVLRIGSARLAEAADPAAEEPVKFTGRNDEFARVVRSVNALHAQAVTLHERVATLEADRKHLVGQRQKMADAREELRAELEQSTAQLERLRTSIGSTFVNLALRTLGLVERQLAVIEQLEEREQDPDRLSTLFKLDHFATVMRRHSENLLVLAGTEHIQHHPGPVPLVDVVRAAVSEIERYERVRISALPPHAHIAGFAADDLSHLLAELMENATSFSPPDVPVEVSGWLLENGEVMISVQDGGIGMTEDRMSRLNARLADFDPEAAYDQEGEDGLGLGLYVVARLAHRLGVRVQLREQKQGGVAAVVVLPQPLLAEGGPAAVPSASPSMDGTASFSLPGADAEANSNVLPGRTHQGDPLVALAEKAVRQRAAAQESADAGADGTTDGTARKTAQDSAADLAEHSAAEASRPEPAERTHPEADTGVRPEDPAGTAVPAQEQGQEPEDKPQSQPEAGRAPAGAGTATGDHPAPQTTSETTMELLLPETAPTKPGSTKPGSAEPGPAAGEPPAARPEPAAPADPYAIGPDTHDRTPDEGEEQLTDKGLPKRTPRISAPASVPRPRTGGVDAEALRRRLGGFRRGAEAGRRDVEAEIAEQTTETRSPDAPAPHRTSSTGPAHAHAEEATGGTVEEASS